MGFETRIIRITIVSCNHCGTRAEFNNRTRVEIKGTLKWAGWTFKDKVVVCPACKRGNKI